MFSKMLPKGANKLNSLSKMNMSGLGAVAMKKVMKDKNVESINFLLESLIENGAKLIACTMSMDVMGISEEELIDGVELGGVGAYLGEAEDSNLNLFI
ncbi:MAG: pyridine nucleotide-disulfide oxidoreductase, partial [Fusobacteria bacterium]|nr:pyridine nucleotide-disulfide oxidoreductase [Fusobacteriota bacterium]